MVVICLMWVLLFFCIEDFLVGVVVVVEESVVSGDDQLKKDVMYYQIWVF